MRLEDALDTVAGEILRTVNAEFRAAVLDADDHALIGRTRSRLPSLTLTLTMTVSRTEIRK